MLRFVEYKNDVKTSENLLRCILVGPQYSSTFLESTDGLKTPLKTGVSNGK